MGNRVFYGQYSLQHWLDLLLTKDVILPDYQRFFVWDEKKVKTLIKALKNQQFVPPVTIGVFKSNNTTQHLLLDGQQRLTSILLAYLGLFPDKKTFEAKLSRRADENDDDVEPEEQLDNILEWDFNKLTEKGSKKDEILSKIPDGNYKVTDFDINEEFLKKTYLGFSFLVPTDNDEHIQQKFYSSVFRSINIQGQRLLPQESRSSLYFLKKELKDFFDPEFIKRITIKNYSSEATIDFVRFLSLLAHYSKDGNSAHVAAGFKSRMEEYYEEYIYFVTGEEPSSRFRPFNEVFADGDFRARFHRLNQSISDLALPLQYNSIIEMDIFLFGLIYQIVFQNRSIDINRRNELVAAIDAKIAEYKGDNGHRKAPGALKYLRERIAASIEIYNNYLNG